MSESIVQKKLARLIQKELSSLNSFKAYGIGAMLTISVVRVTGDLGIAKIYISCFPDGQRATIVSALNDNVWEIRKELAQRIRNKVRKIPEIRFYEDDTQEEAGRIDQLLNEILPDSPTEEEIE